jgi:hypothetical protein
MVGFENDWIYLDFRLAFLIRISPHRKGESFQKVRFAPARRYGGKLIPAVPTRGGSIQGGSRHPPTSAGFRVRLYLMQVSWELTARAFFDQLSKHEQTLVERSVLRVADNWEQLERSHLQRLRGLSSQIGHPLLQLKAGRDLSVLLFRVTPMPASRTLIGFQPS